MNSLSAITNNGTFQLEKTSNGKKIIKRVNQNHQGDIQSEKPSIISRITTIREQSDQLAFNFDSMSFGEEKNDSSSNQSQVQDAILPFSQNFIMSPTREEMKSFSLAQLQAVSNFTLTNQQGKFIFHGPVDVRGADIDKIFHLQNMTFKVNHDANSMNKDAFKQPLEVQYFNLEIPQDYSNNMDQFYLDLKSFCESAGSSQFCYDMNGKILGLFYEKI